jgi:hypothetical protein
MATKTAQAALDNINSYLEEIGGLSKQAAANTEAGSIGGATTHPVKDVDDSTEPATEGARSSENTEDVKKDVPASVDETPEAKAAALRKKAESGGSGTAASDHLQIGMRVAATGEDSSVETASAKSGKDDDGYKGPSKHPARTDNNELDGRKYAEAIDGASLEKLAEMMGELGNNICSHIAYEYKDKQAATAAPAPAAQAAPAPEKAAPAKQAADADLAAQVGWELAGLIDGSMDKQAAEVMVTQSLEGIIKEAEEDGDRVIDFLDSYFAQKQAMGEMVDEAPAPEMPEAGGDPAGAVGPAGGPPMGDPAGGDGLAELGAILEQLGITPEELISALTQGGAGGDPGAGGPGDMGAEAAGAPPMAPPAAPPMAPPGGGMEVAASDKTAAATKAQKQAEMRAYILETVTRGRKK